MRSQTGREPPGGHSTHKLPDSLLAIKIYEVDGEAHPEGMNGFARNDPEALAGSEPLAPQQALIALWPVVGNFHASSEDSVARKIQDSYAQLLRIRAA